MKSEEGLYREPRLEDTDGSSALYRKKVERDDLNGFRTAMEGK